MTRPIPDRAVIFVAQREGCKLTAYPDPASGGSPYTVGYGHCGPAVIPGLTITQTEATAFLRADLGIARDRLYERIGPVVDELSEAQFCALLSFVLNLGASPNWTIWKLLKARQFDQVPAQLMRFTSAAGKPNKGLLNRRAAECSLWAEEAADEPLPSSVTRSAETPPTPAADTKPLAKSKSFMTGLATVGLTCATWVANHIKPILDAITPYTASSDLIAKASSILTTAAAGAAVATLVFIWLKRQRSAAQ